ncbi:hypothetical protein [Falsiroseomonas sp. HW251]|uniref:hypothetical protein n=1 Tax=Falsiroseomonas sp. HW251 TaxID=3390998 RepID=UPI003D31DD4C
MSGPKVVRIVTVEEVQAICRRLMLQVDSGGEELRRAAKRLELLDGGLDASIERRSAQLREMYAAGRWMELQKLAMDTLAFYPAERERLRAAAAAAAEAARSRRRRLADSARTVAEALRSAGQPVPPDLNEVVRSSATAPDGALAELERRVGAALSAVPAPGDSRAGVSAEARQLAERLAGGETTITLAQWAAARIPAPTAAEQRLDRLVAELETLDADEARGFAARLAVAAEEGSTSRRALLTDSLVLDLSARVTALRRAEAARASLQEARASLLASQSEAAATLRARIERELDAGSMRSAEALVVEAKSLLETEEKAAAAAARRRAVLGALSTLGYEVRETMEQTWLRDGRVVLRKPGTTDYGVEVGAPADLNRLQVRLVGSDRPGQPRTAKRDADQEATWCGDFDKLKEMLAAGGGEFLVERAVEAGAQAVKTVSLPAAQANQLMDAKLQPQVRRLT